MRRVQRLPHVSLAFVDVHSHQGSQLVGLFLPCGLYRDLPTHPSLSISFLSRMRTGVRLHDPERRTWCVFEAARVDSRQTEARKVSIEWIGEPPPPPPPPKGILRSPIPPFSRGTSPDKRGIRPPGVDRVLASRIDPRGVPFRTRMGGPDIFGSEIAMVSVRYRYVGRGGEPRQPPPPPPTLLEGIRAWILPRWCVFERTRLVARQAGGLWRSLTGPRRGMEREDAAKGKKTRRRKGGTWNNQGFDGTSGMAERRTEKWPDR